jgi:hypothetical protein
MRLYLKWNHEKYTLTSFETIIFWNLICIQTLENSQLLKSNAFYSYLNIKVIFNIFNSIQD